MDLVELAKRNELGYQAFSKSRIYGSEVHINGDVHPVYNEMDTDINTGLADDFNGELRWQVSNTGIWEASSELDYQARLISDGKNSEPRMSYAGIGEIQAMRELKLSIRANAVEQVWRTLPVADYSGINWDGD